MCSSQANEWRDTHGGDGGCCAVHCVVAYVPVFTVDYDALSALQCDTQ